MPARTLPLSARQGVYLQTTRGIRGMRSVLSAPIAWPLPNASGGGAARTVGGAAHTHDGTGTNSTVTGGVAETNPGKAIASGNQAAAYGDYSQATALAAVAIGAGDGTALAPARAKGARSIAIGGGNTAQAGAIVAIGATAGIAIGTAADCESASTVVIGEVAVSTTNAVGSVAIGTNAIVSDASCVAIGDAASAGNNGNAGYCIAIGWQAQANNPTGDNAVAIGSAANASGSLSFTVLGTASGERAVAVGYASSASGASATAVGTGSNASHDSSSCFGKSAASSFANQVVLGTIAEIVDQPGGVRYKVKAITGNYTIKAAGSSTDKEKVIRVAGAGSLTTITLPSAVANEVGREIWVKNWNDNDVLIQADPATADVIDAGNTISLYAKYDVAVLSCTATGEWSVMMCGMPGCAGS